MPILHTNCSSRTSVAKNQRSSVSVQPIAGIRYIILMYKYEYVTHDIIVRFCKVVNIYMHKMNKF
jgi:hypothetical protein